MKRLFVAFALIAALCSSAIAQFLPFPGPGAGASGGAAAATVAFTATAKADLPGANPVNFTSFAIGTASSDRYVVIAIVGRYSGSSGITAVSINGVSATNVVTQKSTDTFNTCDLYIANVTSGTSVTVAVTGASTLNRIVIGGWELHNLTGAGASTSTATTTTNGGTMTLSSITAGGVALATAGTSTVTTFTWTELTEDFDNAGSIVTGSGASKAYAGGGSSVAITGTGGSSSGPCGVAASFR